MTDEYRRVIADLTTRADGAQAELGAVVRDKDGAGATVNSLRERIATLEADFRARMFYLISVDDGAMSEPDS